MQSYGQPPPQDMQQQYAPPQYQQSAPAPGYPAQQPQQQPLYQQQQPYGGPPPQQQPAYGQAGPAPGYSSYAPPAGGPPAGPLGPAGPPGQGGLPGPSVGMKRSFEETGAAPGGPDTKRQEPAGPPETVLRLLVPKQRVGSIIGKHGAVIKEIKDTTGCRMRVVEALPGADERVVVISSRDDPSLERNAAEMGLFEVHRRVVEGEEPVSSGAGQPQGILTRMLVCHSQAGSIIGKGGVQIKEIRDASGSHIKVLPPDELPPCALSNDRVVQMVGQPLALAKAVAEVSRIVRANPAKERPGGCPPALSAITGMPPGPQAGGLARTHAHIGGPMGGPPLGGGPSGYAAKTPGAGGVFTKNIMMPDDQVGSLIGGQGANINRIRQTSGARIKVHDHDPNQPTLRLIEVTGTPEQVALAEQLVEPYTRSDGGGRAY